MCNLNLLVAIYSRAFFTLQLHPVQCKSVRCAGRDHHFLQHHFGEPRATVTVSFGVPLGP